MYRVVWPGCFADGDDKGSFTTYTDLIHGRGNKHSSIFNSISLASGDGTVGGDDSDLVHYSTKFILLGLKVSDTGGGLPGRVPII